MDSLIATKSNSIAPPPSVFGSTNKYIIGIGKLEGKHLSNKTIMTIIVNVILVCVALFAAALFGIFISCGLGGIADGANTSSLTNKAALYFADVGIPI